MESVVATVSGYESLERFKLIKLINQTGANYVGKLTRSTTHLVCWKFEGKKYNMAKKFGTKVVNHRWFEDCMKENKYLPEDSYMTQSGKHVGPLVWEASNIACVIDKKKKFTSMRGGKVLSDLTNSLNDVYSEDNCVNSTSCLLNRDSEQYDYMDRKNEDSNFYSDFLTLTKKRNICFLVGDTSTSKPVQKGRRLMKKNDAIIRNSVQINLEQSLSPYKDFSQLSNTSSPSTSLTQRNGRYSGHNSSTNGLVEEIEGGKKSGVMVIMNDLNKFTGECQSSGEYALEKDSSNIGKNVACDVENSVDLVASSKPPSSEPSCVICWTDFSSTRGILSCGHRFCYSCIQGWKDRMASLRKVSTCPLCKAHFTTIKKVEDADTCDQKIYSQTIPCTPSDINLFILHDRDDDHGFHLRNIEGVCHQCRHREPEDLLLACHLCQKQFVHSFCLDPPLLPWTCIHCRDLRMLYRRLC